MSADNGDLPHFLFYFFLILYCGFIVNMIISRIMSRVYTQFLCLLMGFQGLFVVVILDLEGFFEVCFMIWNYETILKLN